MKFIEDLYTYDLEEKKLNKLLKKMGKLKRVKNLYVLVFPLFGDGILEIYEYNQLLQPYYKKHTDEIEVVGVAKGRASIEMLLLGLVQSMCNDGYDDIGDIRGYIDKV